LSRATPVLRVEFATSEAFQHEYQSNLVNGGVFIETEEPVGLREQLNVVLVLPFCRKKITLTGEVVHLVTPEMARLGATPGVAVQFEGTAQEIRKRLGPLVQATGTPQHRPPDSGRRRSPRTEARVAARIDGLGEEVRGHTRNLSQSGVLVSVPGRGASVGERVRLTLEHPTTHEQMEVEGVVARAIEGEGGVTALGIHFEPPDEARPAVEEFVDGIQSSEHTRRLGGIVGSIEELGVQDVLQMFGNTAQSGTLTLREGEQEAIVGFDAGMVRYVQLGTASGMKALVRLLGWDGGSFEFHARLEAMSQQEAPLPLDAALLEAAQLLDEFSRVDRARLGHDVTPTPGEDADAAQDLSKIESAVLDLVRAGFPIGRMIDVIPEPDPEIYQALESLVDRGVVAV